MEALVRRRRFPPELPSTGGNAGGSSSRVQRLRARRVRRRTGSGPLITPVVLVAGGRPDRIEPLEARRTGRGSTHGSGFDPPPVERGVGVWVATTRGAAGVRRPEA